MTKVSIIGAGTSGCLAAHALLQSGVDVTLYSDKTPDQWLNEMPPTGTAFIYNENIDIERELGLEHWSDQMFVGNGICMDFKSSIEGDFHINTQGALPRGGAAVDIRMRVHRWLEDLEAAGGKLVIEAVTANRLDQIASQSDLVLLAAGKGELSKIIERDPERSVYDKPQRKLTMFIVDAPNIWNGKQGWGRTDFNSIKFDFFGDTGEFFWVPYTHKTAGASWCVLFEAKAGKQMDVFDDCRTGHECVQRSKTFIKKYAPWQYEFIQDMELVDGDDFAWLKGSFPPTVRKPFGHTASGGLVIPIGDTAITFDPIGGQGGNCAQRNAKFVADAIVARGEEVFDEAWATSVMNGFWEYHGAAAYKFNNMLLEPLEEAGTMVLMELAKNHGFASNKFFKNFPTPKGFFPWFDDVEAAKKIIQEAA